jgi:hypothetical protein
VGAPRCAPRPRTGRRAAPGTGLRNPYAVGGLIVVVAVVATLVVCLVIALLALVAWVTAYALAVGVAAVVATGGGVPGGVGPGRSCRAPPGVLSVRKRRPRVARSGVFDTRPGGSNHQERARRVGAPESAATAIKEIGHRGSTRRARLSSRLIHVRSPRSGLPSSRSRTAKARLVTVSVHHRAYLENERKSLPGPGASRSTSPGIWATTGS